MTNAAHLEDAVTRLRAADARIRAAQDRAEGTGDAISKEWLDALTDYTRALAEIAEYALESLREDLQALRTRMVDTGRRPDPELVVP